jgi:hypothetical protein
MSAKENLKDSKKVKIIGVTRLLENDLVGVMIYILIYIVRIPSI